MDSDSTQEFVYYGASSAEVGYVLEGHVVVVRRNLFIYLLNLSNHPIIPLADSSFAHPSGEQINIGDHVHH